MRNEGLIKSFDAGAAVAAYRIVKHGSGDTAAIQSDDPADAHIGIANWLGAGSGERLDVVLSGVAEVEYGGNVTRGDWLTADSDGKAVATTTAAANAIGKAMVSGVAGDIGSVLLAPASIAATA